MRAFFYSTFFPQEYWLGYNDAVAFCLGVNVKGPENPSRAYRAGVTAGVRKWAGK